MRTGTCSSEASLTRALSLATFLVIALSAGPCLAEPMQGTHSAVSWFTNYGHYMPRIHCLRAADGGPDWFWIVTLIAETAVVILGYLRIYVFWLKCYFAEKAENRNEKLWQLANVFLLCAITSYVLSIVMFFWPAYRLMAVAFGVLVPATVAFALNLKPFEVTFAAVRLLRERDLAQAELLERNRAMRMIFNNVDQGFITVDLEGTMARECSAVLDTWFGPPTAGDKLDAYLAPVAPDYARAFELGLEQLRCDLLPMEVLLAQLPNGFCAGEKAFEVSYTPVLEHGKLQRLLVIVSDITGHLAREQSERQQRELVNLFQHISTDRSGVEEFLTEAATLVAALRTESNPVIQKRLLHTLKGNSAVYGLESYSNLAHEVEAELGTREDGLSGEQKNRLVGAWKDAMQRIGKLLGHTHQGRIEIDRGELEAMMERARAGTPGTELLPVITQWFAEPVERRLERLSEHACALAQRLGKPTPKIVLAANGVRLDPERWTSYWAEMVHVVRNAVDHGIESPDARVLAGKSEAGTLDVRAWLENDQLVIKVSDDGAGVNWDAVKRKAADAGLPHHTRHDLIEALFADGLTTRERSSDTSGRGVGLAALRRVVTGLGGQIQVESEPGGGASFRFQFSAFRGPELAPNPSRVELRSLLPNVA